MSRITLNARGPPVVNGDENPASVRTIMGTSGVDSVLHYFRLYGDLPDTTGRDVASYVST